MRVIKLMVGPLLAAILIVSCATAYKRNGFTGGYSSIQLAEDAFQVKFKGNGYTSKQRVADFCLLRCADIALDHGFTYFIIVDADSYSSTSQHTTPTTTKSRTTVSGYGNWATARTKSTTTGGETYYISKPRSLNTIVCFRKKPEGVLSYDAALIASQIAGQYGL